MPVESSTGMYRKGDTVHLCPTSLANIAIQHGDVKENIYLGKEWTRKFSASARHMYRILELSCRGVGQRCSLSPNTAEY